MAGRGKKSFKGLQLSFLLYSSRLYYQFVHNGQVRSALYYSTIYMSVCRFFIVLSGDFHAIILFRVVHGNTAHVSSHRSILTRVYLRIYGLFVGLITKSEMEATRHVHVHIIVYACGRSEFNEITRALCFNNFE